MFITKHGKRKAFLTGFNSTCQYHAQTHFDLYMAKCSQLGIPLHHHAIPCLVWKKLLAEKGRKQVKTQLTLDKSLAKTMVPKDFTWDGILHTVAQFIICDDQVVLLASHSGKK